MRWAGRFGDAVPGQRSPLAGCLIRSIFTGGRPSGSELGWKVGNVDATVLLERPRLIKHRSVLRENLSKLLDVPTESVNVKGKSGEGLGPVGQGELVEVHASVLLHRAD